MFSKLTRRPLTIGAAFAVLTLLAVGNSHAEFPAPGDIPIPELGDVQVPEPERMTLDNGMIIYLYVNEEFPLVDARALIRAGSIHEPADKVGLASITGQVMRSGGSTNIDGDALDLLLESMGASVETSIGQTSGTATISTLAEDFPKGVEILADLLRRPAFPEEKIALAQKQERTAIASRNDESMGILGQELPKLLYGADSPYARHTEYATIDATTRADIVQFHEQFFHPDRIILTVYGDFDPLAVKKILQDNFGDWRPATSPMPADPPADFADISGNYLIEKADMTNSAVVFGLGGTRMDHPDYAAMQLYHDIMGGGFSSRLFNEIRTKRGLAYAAGSGAGAGMHHPGGQIFFSITQSDSTVATRQYIADEIEKSLSEPFKEEEVQRAKDAILNSMVFDFTSEFAVLNRLAAYEYYGYPKDFLQQYQTAVKTLGPDEILAAAGRNVKPEAMASLIMGNPENFAASLGSVGEIENIDISIPEAAGDEIPVATAADLERGQGLLQGAAEAHGAGALSKVTDMVVAESGEFSVQGMTLPVSFMTERVLPDCEKVEQKLPMGTVVMASCGETAWMDQMQGPKEMPPEARADLRTGQVRDYVSVLSNYSGMLLQALPDRAEVDGKSCDVVFVQSDVVQGWKIFLDAESHQILQMQYKDRSMMSGAPVVAREVFGDYRQVDGVAWPYLRKIHHDDDLVATVTVTDVQFNTGLTKAAFEMPTD